MIIVFIESCIRLLNKKYLRMKNKILIADDEKDLLEMMKNHFESEGYIVQTATSGEEAVEKYQAFRPDLIILDLILPEKDGVEACIEIRNIPKSKEPAIAFLTSRKEEYSQIAGYEAGADDYIIKPIKLKILSLKVKALLRRIVNNVEETSEEKRNFGDLLIDQENFMVYKNGKEVYLRRKEYDLLFLLTTKPGKVFIKDTIMTRVWGEDVIVSMRNVDVQIRKLREKIGEHYIKTVKGVGYKFVDE